MRKLLILYLLLALPAPALGQLVTVDISSLKKGEGYVITKDEAGNVSLKKTLILTPGSTETPTDPPKDPPGQTSNLQKAVQEAYKALPSSVVGHRENVAALFIGAAKAIDSNSVPGDTDKEKKEAAVSMTFDVIPLVTGGSYGPWVKVMGPAFAKEVGTPPKDLATISKAYKEIALAIDPEINNKAVGPVLKAVITALIPIIAERRPKLAAILRIVVNFL